MSRDGYISPAKASLGLLGIVLFLIGFWLAVGLTVAKVSG